MIRLVEHDSGYDAEKSLCQLLREKIEFSASGTLTRYSTELPPGGALSSRTSPGGGYDLRTFKTAAVEVVMNAG
jgi:hypothetical protein